MRKRKLQPRHHLRPLSIEGRLPLARERLHPLREGGFDAGSILERDLIAQSVESSSGVIPERCPRNVAADLITFDAGEKGEMTLARLAVDPDALDQYGAHP